MTRSDIGVIVIIYATCLLFFYLTLQLKAAAQIYPMCLIAVLGILNTLYLARCVLRLAKNRAGRVVNDFPEIFTGFVARQFFFVVGSCLVYLGLLHYLGFYLASFIYLIGVMYGLKVRQLYIWLTAALLGGLVYSVFTLFLKVPLPKGVFFA